MSAEPVSAEDRRDPLVILRDLPERERVLFLRQYHEAVEQAHDPAAYWRLQRVLHVWSLAVAGTGGVPRALG
ncbi:MAG TPA: DUF6247 family protein [Streptosporangiaceae bacterium]|jgi:hypothetical protein